MAEGRQFLYYVTPISSELGKNAVRLAQRIDDVMQAADKLAIEMRVDEWWSDPRYVAGGIWRFVYNNPPKAKKALMVVARGNNGTYECAPNPEFNRGLRLAKKIAALPHVTDKEVCEMFNFDYNDPQYKEHIVPQFFIVGNEWVYVRSSFDLAPLCTDLTPCEEATFDAALKFIEEQESQTLLPSEE